MSQGVQNIFEKLYFDGPIDDEWKKIIKRVLHSSTILIVPGFFVNSLKLSKKRNMIGIFFEDQINLFEKVGCKVIWVNTQTEQSILINSKTIQKCAEKVSGSIIFLSHSRGCNDVLQSLLDFDQLKDKTVGWVSIQGLFGGSPISNFLESFHLDKIYGKFLTNLGGNVDVIHEMTQQSRAEFLKTNDLAIRLLIEKIPTLSVGSFLSFKWHLRPDSFLKWSRDMMSLSGYKNDGIVNFESSLLPYSKQIILKEVDHIETIVYNSFRNLDRKKLTQALFCSLFFEDLASS